MHRKLQFTALVAVAITMAVYISSCSKIDKITGPQDIASITQIVDSTVGGVQKLGVAGPYSSSGFATQYCTWYAASEFDKVAPSPRCNWGGDAGTWIEHAASAGWKTYSYPAYPPTAAGFLSMPNGTIIVWTNSGAGHVAVLRSVAQNGMYIQEKNWPVGSGVSPLRYLTWSEVVTRGSTGSYHLSGYIPPWRK